MSGLGLRDDFHRYSYGKGSPHSFLTVKLNSAFHQIYIPFADVQTQTGTSILAGGGIIHLSKWIKNIFEFIFGNTDTGIGNYHRDIRPVVLFFPNGSKAYVSPISKFNGIIKKVA